MGSRIGDYIHYRYQNYLEHGTTRKGDESFDIGEIANAHRAAMLSFVNQRDSQKKKNIKSTLESELNFFYGNDFGNIADLGYTKDEQLEIQDMIIEGVQRAIAADHPNTDLSGVNWRNLKALRTSEVQPVVASKYGTFGQNDYTWTKAIENRLHELATIVDRSHPSGQVLSAADMQRVSDLQTQYDGIRSEIEQEVRDKKLNPNAAYRKFMIAGKESRKSFVSELNSLIGKARSAILSGVQGYLGEYVPVITQQVLHNYGRIQAEKLTREQLLAGLSAKGLVVGQDKSTRLLDSSKFMEGGTNSDSDAFWIGNINAKAQAKDDKIDMWLEMPDGEKIATSAKNVNLRSGYNVGVLSGASYLKMLQDYPTFANHYINITAEHGKDGGAPFVDDVRKMHQAMKVMIAAYALAGGLYGQNSQTGEFGHGQKAEVFLVNDNSGVNGNFTVYFISDIIKNININTDLLFGYDNPEWENVFIVSNSPYRAASRRCAMVLADIHAAKYKIGIAPEAFVHL